MLAYIGGYGHSGSTLLESLLAASPRVLACGEVASAARHGMKKASCTCGAPIQECEVWSPFAKTSGGTGWKHVNLSIALLQAADGRYTAVIDSSKTAWHSAVAPFQLRRALQDDFLLVHIVRNPKAVCWSMIKKAKRKGQRPNRFGRCAFTALSWLVANLACELFGLLHPKHYVSLRYEDFVCSPRENVSHLLSILVPGAGTSLEYTLNANNRHQLYGNRMRTMMPSFEDVREDRAWQAQMPRRYKVLVGTLTWPLYGYSRQAI